jgi:hypothetical protein
MNPRDVRGGLNTEAGPAAIRLRYSLQSTFSWFNFRLSPCSLDLTLHNES